MITCWNATTHVAIYFNLYTEGKRDIDREREREREERERERE